MVIHKNSEEYRNKKKFEEIITECDIVHIFGGWTLFYVNASLYARKFKKRIIIHPMGYFEKWSLSQKRIKKFLAWNIYQKKILLNADLIHCASKNEENSLKLLDKRLKTAILPFGIHKKKIKKMFKNNLNKKCLFFSRFHKKKGLDKLIEAWTDLSNPEWRLDIVGFGKQQFYKSLVKKKLNHNIKFFKPITSEKKKFKLFDKYDLLVLPSSNENFGIVILEALSRGLPVLTTNETPWSLIQDRNAGWIINDSFIELKLVLNQIFNSSKRSFYIKKKNSIKLAKKFTIEELSKLYEKSYRNVYHEYKRT